MQTINPSKLELMVFEASKTAFEELLLAHPEESFYTFGLWTDDSLQFLNPAANTEERLDQTVEDYKKNVDPEYDTITTHNGMRWSYGDWGFFPADTGENLFAEINEELGEIFDLDIPEEDFIEIITPLWDAIVNGLNRLREEEVLKNLTVEKPITLLVVGDLDDEIINTCAKILNTDEIAEKYINWNCDE